jgi:hypothetical protein
MKRIAALLIVTAVLVAGCAGSKWVQTDVIKQHEFVVVLEQRQDQSAAGQLKYGQPYQLDVAELKILLGELSYIEKAGLKNKSKQSPVFQPAEVDRLAPVLAETLAKADASQRLRFISFNLEPAVVFSVSRKTEGVVFVGADGRLNIAFNYVNANRHANETSAMFSKPAVNDPLSITNAESILTAPDAYAELHELQTGRQAPLWVVVDLVKLRAAINAGTVPTVKAPAAAVPAAASPALASPVGATGTPVQAAAPAAAAAAELRQEEVKGKLKFLKELLSEGLISEQDYNAKKLELLDKIN